MKKIAISIFFPVSFWASSILAEETNTQKTEILNQGKILYAYCAACHGPDGQGMMAGPSKMAPSLSGSPIIQGDPSILALVILKGITKEDQKYLGMMAPLEGAFPKDEQLAAIMSYVRQTFGNNASLVSAEQAKAFREKWKNEKESIKRARLLTMLSEKSK